MRILLTGISGYLGSGTARALAAHEEVEAIVGVDRCPPRAPLPKTEVHQVDLCEVDPHLFERIDVAAHFAWILNPTRRPAWETSQNFGGLRAFLSACEAAAVPRIVGLSSTTAYGAAPDNPVPLPESALPRPEQAFQYGREKAAMEGVLRHYAAFHPGVELVLLRPCIVVGPGADNFITRALSRSPAPLVRGYDPPLQLIHEADLFRAVSEAIVRAPAGTYNVAPEGTVPLSAVPRRLGTRVVPVSPALARRIARLGWALAPGRLVDAPATVLPFIQYPWVADGSRLRQVLGLEFRYDTAAALEAWAAARSAGGASRA